MQKPNYYLINAITLYRLAAAPVLVFLIFTDRQNLFKWLLALSFFTDLIDGFLARKFHVTSTLGSRLDSVADDLTIVSAIIGVLVFKFEFIKENSVVFIFLLTIFLIQTILSLVKYHKISSFHTYLAKTAAILQGSFLILIFFIDPPIYILFYFAALLTALELIEEIILVFLLPEWKTNVKGLYWVLKSKTMPEKNREIN